VNFGVLNILKGILFQEKCNFCPPFESITTRVREDLEGGVVSCGVEHILSGFRVLFCLGGDGCNGNAIRNKETAVEAQPECANEVAVACAVLTLSLRQEIRCTGLSQRPLKKIGLGPQIPKKAAEHARFVVNSSGDIPIPVSRIE
jgi:hypothetical protein